MLRNVNLFRGKGGRQVTPQRKRKKVSHRNPYGYRGKYLIRDSAPSAANLLDKEELKKELPEVGAVLLKVPTFYHYSGEKISQLYRPCKVIAIYPDTLCYLVEYTTPDGNYRELHKLTGSLQEGIIML